MKRRQLIRNALAVGFGFTPVARLLAGPLNSSAEKNTNLPLAGPRKPITIYNNWSSYDELSDNIPLAEDLAMKELNELIRLKKNGVHVDYYVMDAFPRRSWGGSPPNGIKMDEFFKIIVTQGKKNIPLIIQYDKMIWSGLSYRNQEQRSKGGWLLCTLY